MPFMFDRRVALLGLAILASESSLPAEQAIAQATYTLKPMPCLSGQ